MQTNLIFILMTLTIGAFAYSGGSALLSSDDGTEIRDWDRWVVESPATAWDNQSAMSFDVVFIGDSHLSIPEAHWAFLLDIDANAFLNMALGGNTTKGVIAQMDSIAEKNPKLIVLQVGTNDLNQGFSINEVYSDYRTLIEKIADLDAEVIVTGTVQCRVGVGCEEAGYRQREDLNRKLAELSVQNGMKFVDVNESLFPGGHMSDDLFLDEIHLSLAAYLKFAEALKPAIEETAFHAD